MDSSMVSDAKTGIELLIAAVGAVSALVGFVIGKVAKFKKKKVE